MAAEYRYNHKDLAALARSLGCNMQGVSYMETATALAQKLGVAPPKTHEDAREMIYHHVLQGSPIEEVTPKTWNTLVDELVLSLPGRDFWKKCRLHKRRGKAFLLRSSHHTSVGPSQLEEIRVALSKHFGFEVGVAFERGSMEYVDVEAVRQKQEAVWNWANSDDFLDSYSWRKLRMEVIKRDGARCSCCGATPADGVRMHVDHIKPRRKFPELALDPTNLQVLCEECNHGKGNWDETDWRPPQEPALTPEQQAHLREMK